MIDALLELPAHLRERLVGALESGQLAAPYTRPGVRAALGSSEAAEAVCVALQELEARGVPGPAVSLALATAAQYAARVDRPTLVWSGPEVQGLAARDTRRVYDELIASAQRSIWVSTFAYYDGQAAFKSLAERMDAVCELQVRLLLNIQRKWGDETSPDQLIVKFAERLWKQEWPGGRRPEVFYDPRSLTVGGAEGVLHAKALIVDDEAAFVTSANLTEAAFDRNFEVGILSRDRVLAASLARYFGVLIEQGRLVALPGG